MRIKLIVEYDGTDLCGWQRQANGPTVQQHLEDALAAMLDHPVRITGASRTDAGVHARGQVAMFETERTIPLHGVRRGVNARLPPCVAVVGADVAPDDWHPRHSATGKRYRYTVLARQDRSPRWHHRAWHRPRPLDAAAMAEAASALVGTHDFAAFRAAACDAKTTTRRMDQVAVMTSPEPGILTVEVSGTAFLRNMVRIVAGTLIDVGEGRLAAAEVAEILTSLDRTRAGQTAPAHGLELVEVHYDGSRPYRPRPGSLPEV